MSNPPPKPNRRILIVDDNRAIHDDFRKILGQQSRAEGNSALEAALFDEPAAPTATAIDFELTSAYQGAEALAQVEKARAEKQPFAMVFMDIRMPPGWDGVETTERVWKVDPDLQVVICTAYSDYSWEEMKARLGQPDKLLILKKPFDTVEVLQYATALTEKWDLSRKAQGHAANLEHEVETRTAELRTSEERYRLITENANELIAILDAEGGQIYRSPSYERMLGYSPRELEFTESYKVIDPSLRDGFTDMLRDTIKNGADHVMELRVQHREGHWVTLDTHCGPFRNDLGRVVGALIVSRDVTEKKKLELQLRQSQKLESIGQLATGIAHEINTPTQFIGDNLTFLRSAFADLDQLAAAYDELLRAAQAGAVPPELLTRVVQVRDKVNPGYLRAEVPQAIEQSLGGVARTSRIVKAMRTFAHQESTVKTEIDLTATVEDALTITRNEWRHVAETECRIDPAIARVAVYPGEFSQVLLNLIINATHAIADRVGDGGKGLGRISITGCQVDDWAEIRVRDTGTGIPEKVRERIFDPFFTTKPIGKGTGQGLTLARSIIVDKHHGTLTFETEPGAGTTFILRVPLGRAQATAA